MPRSAVRYDTDMRSRATLLAFMLVTGALALPHFAHAAIPFFGPIIPPPSVSGVPGSDTCAAGWGMLITVINNIIELLLTLAIVFVAPIMIAYAGFLYVINPYKPGERTHANSILLNTIAGIVVALAAWLIVDAVMAVLYNKNAPGFAGATWWSIVSSGGVADCINLAGATPQVPSAPPGITTSVTPTGPAISTVGTSGQPVTVSFAPTQSDASLQGGYAAANKYSAEIASACSGSAIPNCPVVITSIIAQESGGNPSVGCNAVGACGIIQLTQANGGTSCLSTDTTCITSQISKGVALFQKGYNLFPNIPNALAAYNSGVTTQAGQSVSGKNSALVASVDCPGYYAWQCATNPGGLAETQGYVANICRRITLNGGTCN